MSFIMVKGTLVEGLISSVRYFSNVCGCKSLGLLFQSKSVA